MTLTTVRELLTLLGKSEVSLDSPIWIGTTIPGLHEVTKAWVEADGTLHLTDEEAGAWSIKEIKQACEARGLKLIQTRYLTKDRIRIIFEAKPSCYWTADADKGDVEGALDRWKETQ